MPIVREVQRIEIQADRGVFVLKLEGGTTTEAIDLDDPTADIQNQIRNLYGGSTDIIVSRDGDVFTIVFDGALAGQDVAKLEWARDDIRNSLEIDDPDLTPRVEIETLLQGTTDPLRDNLQTITIDANAGEFALRFEGLEAQTRFVQQFAGIGTGVYQLERGIDEASSVLTVQVAEQVLLVSDYMVDPLTNRVEILDTTPFDPGAFVEINYLSVETAPIAYNAGVEDLLVALQEVVDPANSDPDLPHTRNVEVHRVGNDFIVIFQGVFRTDEAVYLALAGTSTDFSGTVDIISRVHDTDPLGGIAFGINYYNVETLNIDLGSGHDIANVQGTTARTNLRLHEGDERIYVSSLATEDFVSSLTTDFLLGDLDEVDGMLNLRAGAGRHLLMISDEAATAGDNGVLITDTTARALTSDPAVPDGNLHVPTTEIYMVGLAEGAITYSTNLQDGNFADGITIWTSSGADTITIDGTHKRGDGSIGSLRTVTTLNTGLGDDEVTVELDEFLPDASDRDDGFFVLNTQGPYNDYLEITDEDTVDASDSTLPLVIFGGQGRDTIIAGQAADIVFGDRGRVLYFDSVPEGLDSMTVAELEDLAVTVLGHGGPGDKTDGITRHPVLIFTVDETVGGNDEIHGSLAADIILGGGNDDAEGDPNRETITGNKAADIILGDYGMITLIDGVASRVETTDHGQGGDDVIEGNEGEDILIGGSGGDTIYGDDDGGTSGSADGVDRIIGDNGEVILVDGVITEIRMTDEVESTGGSDTISGNFGDDIILGGVNSSRDVIEGNLGNDIIVGDNAELIYSVNSVGVITLEEIRTLPFASDGTTVLGGGDDISGNAGSDILIGGTGDDRVYGDSVGATAGSDDLADIIVGDQVEIILTDNVVTNIRTTTRETTEAGDSDILVGAHGDDILIGGADSDFIDGGDAIVSLADGPDNDDLIFGDHVELTRRPIGEITDPRFQILKGRLIYSRYDLPAFLQGLTTAEMPISGNAAGEVLVEGIPKPYRSVDATGAARPVPIWAEWQIVDLDHSQSIEENPVAANRYGDDYIAGGNANDVIFGQLGNDIIQGDGSIETAIQGMEPQPIVGAKRVVDNTNPTIQLTPSLAPVTREILDITPSFEAVDDGDDYIEGNGGSDVIFGNLGQDDIIGDNSSLFTLDTRDERLPAGEDIIFGGSGERADHDHKVTEDNRDTIILEDVHARDSDAIAGDNANIYRIVGTGDITLPDDLVVDPGTGDTGGFLEFTYDAVRGAAVQRIIVRAVELLDYTPGGPDYADKVLADGSIDPTFTDIGGADEVHGESGDDFIYGMVGKDILFGDSESDDIVGGWGADWISGGQGTDGIIGDDGRVLTARYAELPGNNTSEANPNDLTHYAELLNGIFMVDELNKLIRTPGDIQKAIINPTEMVNGEEVGEIFKTVDLTPFNLDPNMAMQNRLFEPGYANDIIFGGLGNDFLHGSAGDDAISGTEALPEYFNAPVNPDDPTVAGDDLLRFDPNRIEFADYDEEFPRTKLVPFVLNFDPAGDPTPDDPDTELVSDDNFDEDAIFGDLGNDWLVGGPDNDNLFGGFGANLLDADDNKDTPTPDNYGPDGPDIDIQDRAYGGAGRDVMIANTGGDRLMDWAGEFNSFIVPFAPFGEFTVTRGVPPHLFQFLYDLSESLGADPSRAVDTGNSEDRNGEPDGELGLVTQKDGPLWRDQTGAPIDPQPGNIPGGPRLTLRGVDFNSGVAQGFTPDTGNWTVSGGRYEVSPAEISDTIVIERHRLESGEAVVYSHGVGGLDIGGLTDGQTYYVIKVDQSTVMLALTAEDAAAGKAIDLTDMGSGGEHTLTSGKRTVTFDPSSALSLTGDAASVFHVGEYLPSYFEVTATINAGKPTAGLKSNSYVLFDYVSPTDFKFAGVNISTDKLEIGHVTSAGWIVDVQRPAQLKPNKDYDILLALNGATVTIVVNGEYMSYAFAPRVDDDGFTYGLNFGMVGIGANNAVARIDNVVVQILKPDTTYEYFTDFSTVDDKLKTPITGIWQLNGGRYEGSSLAGEDEALITFDLSVGANSRLELEGTFTTDTLGGFFFDYYSERDYKLTAVLPGTNEVVIGHWGKNGTLKYDAIAELPFVAGPEYDMRVSLKGTTVSVAVKGGDDVYHEVLGYVFYAVTVDGSFGLLSMDGQTSFDQFAMNTDDPAFIVPDEASSLMAASAPTDPVGAEGFLTYDALNPVVEAALECWREALGADNVLQGVTLQIVDFDGLTLGMAVGDTIQIDADAAGFGWFVDETPLDDTEFDAGQGPGEMLATDSSEAFGRMDLLTVVMHELGHVLGFEDLDPEAHDLMSATLDTGVRWVPEETADGQSQLASLSLAAMDWAAGKGRVDDSMAWLFEENPWHLKLFLNNAEDDSYSGQNDAFELLIPAEELEWFRLRRAHEIAN
jgi:Ca2+-binding RTX toxin-like protein